MRTRLDQDLDVVDIEIKTNSKRTGILWEDSPVAGTMNLDVLDELVVFLRGPWTFLEAIFIATW